VSQISKDIIPLCLQQLIHRSARRSTSTQIASEKMGDDDYLEVPLTAPGMPTKLGDPIRQPTLHGMTASPPSAKGQSMNQPTEVDEPTNSESVAFIKPDDLDCKLSKTSATVALLGLKSTEVHDESRRISDADTIKTYHQGIYWRSPITMVTFFLLGIFISVGHHLYYNSLVGQAVGDVNDQQMVLRSVVTFRKSLLHLAFSRWRETT
jgi:hypothetical protein